MPVRSTRKKWVLILFYCLFMFFMMLDVFVMVAQQSQVLADFQVGLNRFLPYFYSLVVVMTIALPTWGRAFDLYDRNRVLAVAGVLWSLSNWLTAIAPTFITYGISIVLGTVDNGSFGGVFSLAGDEYSPNNRGKVLGLIQGSQALAYLVSLLFSMKLFLNWPWRGVYIGLGLIGLVIVGVVLNLGGTPKRGESEPALQGISYQSNYSFEWEAVIGTLGKPGFYLLCALSFLVMLPWQGLINHLSTFLVSGMGVSRLEYHLLLLPALIGLCLGHPLAGFLGDRFFRRSRKSRVYVSLAAIILAIVFLILAFWASPVGGMGFRFFLALTGLFMGMSRPNLLAMTMDITLPEVRASALSFITLFQFLGILFGPLMFSKIGTPFAPIWLTGGAWGVAAILLFFLSTKMPAEIEAVRRQMAYRSQLETRAR